MKKYFLLFVRVLFLLIVLVLITTCNNGPKEKIVYGIDLNQIKARGKIIAVTDFSPMNYFIYRGQPLGYQYELLQEYANSIGMKIELVISRDLDNTMNMLRSGQADIIALNYAVTNERKKQVAFTVPHGKTRLVLVQRIPGTKGTMGEIVQTPQIIRDLSNLSGSGVEIAVQKSSAAAVRLKNLSEEMGDSLQVNELPLDDEELVEMVATGELDYAVCDENGAMVCRTYFSNLDCETPVSFSQKLAWAVRKDSPDLLASLNTWLIGFKKTA